MSNVETPDETPEEAGNMGQEATDTIAHEAGEAIDEIIHDAIDAAVKVTNELNAELTEDGSDAEGGGEE